MNTVATVISLSGLAWAVGPDGTSRLLAPGESIAPEETLVTASTTRVELDFGDGRLLAFTGGRAQNNAGEVTEGIPVIVLPEATQGTNTLLPQQQGLFGDGHAFVQTVRIAEIIEADGITPLTIAAIKEILTPLAMSWDRDPEEPEEERLNQGFIHARNTDARSGDDDESPGDVGGGDPGDGDPDGGNGNPGDGDGDPDGGDGNPDGGDGEDQTPPSVSVELTGTGDDGVYNEDEIGEDGTVTAEVTLNPGTEVGDTLVVTDKDGNVLLERPVT
ncbi:hypothetical protein, partial [Oceanimonas baumannii]